MDMKMEKIVISFVIMALMLAIIVTAMPENSAKDTIKPKIFEKKFSISDKKYVPDEIIVKFKSEVKDDVISKINSRHGASVKYTSPYGKFKTIKIPKGKTVSEMVESYKKDSNVEYAEPNYICHTLMVPNDQYYSLQWHLDNTEYGGINMEAAWEISTGDPSVVVAIVDTGIAYEDYTDGRKQYCQAPDLANTCFVQGKDFVNNDGHPNDDNNHGTHVAGTVAQSTNNGIGVAGVAFETCLMPVKVLDSRGSGTYLDVADGIYFATNNGAQVISLSLGGSSDSTTLRDAVKYAYETGVTVIAAAGNDGKNGISYPAAYDDYVIAVGATQYDKNLAPYSNYGSSLDLVAPGGNTGLDQNGDGYADGVLQQTFKNSWQVCNFVYYFFQGTSMATPHVSGVAALLIANGKAITPDEVRSALQETAEDLGADGRDDIYGHGLVDAYAALQWTAGSECTEDANCGFCEECVDNTCVYQSDSEDLKNDCPSGDCASGFCNGAGACDYTPSTTECRESAGICDLAEFCTGSFPDCPADAKSTAECRPEVGVCDVAEFCNGVSNDCPTNAFLPSTTECRPSAGECDIAESCTGNSAQCPTNSYQPDSTPCDDSQFCTVDDVCTEGVCGGVAKDCSDGVACTADSCDEVEDVCVHTPDDSFCDDGLYCNGAEICDATLGCQSGTPVDCNDGEPCTTDSCDEDIDECKHTWPACGPEDGCCGPECSGTVSDPNYDSNCAASVICWLASHQYLNLKNGDDMNQLKKFCKCAEGNYAYQRYRTSWRAKTAYMYESSDDDMTWDTIFVDSASRPVYKVKCSDGVYYRTNEDYYQ